MHLVINTKIHSINGFLSIFIQTTYKHHSEARANQKSTELLEFAVKLENNPLIGKVIPV